MYISPALSATDEFSPHVNVVPPFVTVTLNTLPVARTTVTLYAPLYAGVRDVLTKSLGSTNPHNVVKATLKGLLSMRDAVAVAQRRGMTVQEMFTGG